MVESHNLVKEFPEFREKIHNLKTSDAHFRKLFDSYDALDHEIRRIEDGADAASDFYLEGLKKKRMVAKDELFKMLNKAA